MMNTPQSWRRLLLCSATSLMFLPWTLSADDAAPTPAPKVERRIEVIRAEGAPRVEKEMRWVVQQGDDHDEMDTEPVTFLGVETVRVSPTLTEQLGLDRGIGLVVQRVIEETAAAEALKKHDIITKLDDQLIVSPDQLGVLVRAKKPGTEVTLTFVRGGKVQTAKVALQARKPAKAHVFHLDGAHEDHSMILPDGAAFRGGVVHSATASTIDRADVDRMLAKFKDKNASEFAWVSKDDGPVVRMLNINDGNVVFSDGEGMVELKSSEGIKHLLLKSPKGEVVFDGPVATEAQRAELSEAVKQRLEKVEGIETLEFRTDDSFETEDVRVIAPQGGSVRVIRQGEHYPIAMSAKGV